MNQTNLLALRIVEWRFRTLIPWILRGFDSPAETSNSGGGAGSSNGETPTLTSTVLTVEHLIEAQHVEGEDRQMRTLRRTLIEVHGVYAS